MASNNKPKQIKVTIYPNQEKWINTISKTLNQSKRQTYLECFACYIGDFKQSLRREVR